MRALSIGCVLLTLSKALVGGDKDFTLNKVLCANDCRYGGFQSVLKHM